MFSLFLWIWSVRDDFVTWSRISIWYVILIVSCESSLVICWLIELSKIYVDFIDLNQFELYLVSCIEMVDGFESSSGNIWNRNAVHSNQDVTSVYYIHPSDDNTTQLISVKFNGIGFSNWKRSVMVSLSAKHKLWFIDGIVVPDGRQVRIMHTGSVQINENMVIHDVFHVPNFHYNLLSVLKLCKDIKCTITFNDNECMLHDHLQKGRATNSSW